MLSPASWTIQRRTCGQPDIHQTLGNSHTSTHVGANYMECASYKISTGPDLLEALSKRAVSLAAFWTTPHPPYLLPPLSHPFPPLVSFPPFLQSLGSFPAGHLLALAPSQTHHLPPPSPARSGQHLQNLSQVREESKGHRGR